MEWVEMQCFPLHDWNIKNNEMIKISKSAKNIVFLEDNLDFASSVLVDLENFGYQVIHFARGEECIRHLMSQGCDLCIFDWHLPDMTGDQVMQALAQVGRMPPVIFLSSNDHEETVSNMLMAGADDYVVKPPNPRVLRARIESLLRRTQSQSPLPESETVGELTVDYQKNSIFKGQQIVPLTGYESMIAMELFKRRGQIVPRADLYALLGISEMAIDTRRLDVHISHLRRKLGLNAMGGWKLSSVYQRGYRLEYTGGL